MLNISRKEHLLVINKICIKFNKELTIKMMINTKSIRDEFKKRKIRIGKEVLNLIIKSAEKEIKLEVEKIIRNARLVGRKTIKKEDFQTKI